MNLTIIHHNFVINGWNDFRCLLGPQTEFDLYLCMTLIVHVKLLNLHVAKILINLLVMDKFDWHLDKTQNQHFDFSKYDLYLYMALTVKVKSYLIIKISWAWPQLVMALFGFVCVLLFCLFLICCFFIFKLFSFKVKLVWF